MTSVIGESLACNLQDGEEIVMGGMWVGIVPPKEEHAQRSQCSF